MDIMKPNPLLSRSDIAFLYIDQQERAQITYMEIAYTKFLL